MEKDEEETREILLPNWQGSGSMGITLEENDEGVFVKQLVEDSPVAQTGVVKEGDQIVGATVYFDQMSSEEVKHLLSSMGHHTVGLKLQRKGDRSPLPGMTWSQEAFNLKSPDVVLSGDDEDYKRIYTKKIKPRLKSEDLAEMENTEMETQTRTITVTRKVTAYTVDVTGPEGASSIDSGSPEFKIKVPRQEFTERSRMGFETPQGKTVIRTAKMSGKSLQIKDLSTDMQTAHSDISVSGPTEFTHRIIDSAVTEKGWKAEKPDVTVPGFHSHMTMSSRLVSDSKNIQMEISPPGVVSTEIHIPSIDVSQANGKSVQIEVPGMNISGTKFPSSTAAGWTGAQTGTGSFNVVGISKFSKFGTSDPQIQGPGIVTNQKTGMQTHTVSISRPLQDSAGTDVSLPKITTDVKVQTNSQVLGGINPSEVNLSFPGTASDINVCDVDLKDKGYGDQQTDLPPQLRSSGFLGSIPSPYPSQSPCGSLEPVLCGLGSKDSSDSENCPGDSMVVDLDNFSRGISLSPPHLLVLTSEASSR